MRTVFKMLSNNQKKQEKEKLEEGRTMSITRLRTFKGFEACTDKEALQIITALESFAYIICRHVQNSNLL